MHTCITRMAKKHIRVKQPQGSLHYVHICKYVSREESGSDCTAFPPGGVDWIGVTSKGMFNCPVWGFSL